MRRRTKITIEPKHILIFCSVVCIGLIIVSFKYKEKLEPVKTVVGDVITPMQKGINSIGSWISNKMDIFTNIQTLLEENEKLTKKLDEVSNENKILQMEKYELENLRKLYQLDKKYSDYKKVAARVTGNDPGNWYHEFTIDKGTNHGLAVDMNVMAGNGLVGIITEVGHNWAAVRSIVDDKSNVTGMFLKTSDICNVKGNLKMMESGVIEVEIYDKDADIKDGYEIVTSYNSAKYLQGILIGYVSNVTLDVSRMTKTGILTPAVNFNKLDTVLVITQLKEKKY